MPDVTRYYRIVMTASSTRLWQLREGVEWGMESKISRELVPINILQLSHGHIIILISFPLAISATVDHV